MAISEATLALTNSLSKPTFRKSFVNDPLKALERAQIDSNDIPEAFLSTLASLSLEELTLLVDIKKSVDSGTVVAGTEGGFFF
jgi:hypothetical protein